MQAAAHLQQAVIKMNIAYIVRIVPALLQKIYGALVANPPINAIIIVRKNFCQSRSPTAASNDTKLHSNHFNEQQKYVGCRKLNAPCCYEY